MPEPSSDDRHSRGLAMFEEVYGNVVPAPPPGAAAAFDLLIIEQQFAEVWSRRALSIPLRRLLTIGVVAANGGYDTLELQFRRALQTGELTVEQVREVAMHLITYVGTPASGDLLRVSENAIASHLTSEETT